MKKFIINYEMELSELVAMASKRNQLSYLLEMEVIGCLRLLPSIEIVEIDEFPLWNRKNMDITITSELSEEEVTGMVEKLLKPYKFIHELLIFEDREVDEDDFDAFEFTRVPIRDYDDDPIGEDYEAFIDDLITKASKLGDFDFDDEDDDFGFDDLFNR